jgi:Ca2+-binding EF-hand superfamily protein
MDISAIGSMGSMMSMQGMQGMQKPDAAEASSEFINELDSDGDGQLSSTEFSIGDGATESTEAFDVLDTNEDGFVSQEELEADMQSQMNAMKARFDASGLGGMASSSNTESYQQLLDMVGNKTEDDKASGTEAYRQMQDGMHDAGAYGEQSFSSGLSIRA